MLHRWKELVLSELVVDQIVEVHQFVFSRDCIAPPYDFGFPKGTMVIRMEYEMYFPRGRGQYGPGPIRKARVRSSRSQVPWKERGL